MNNNQQTDFCVDQRLENIADSLEILKDAINTGSEEIIKAAMEAMKDNPDLPYHFLVSSLELDKEQVNKKWVVNLLWKDLST